MKQYKFLFKPIFFIFSLIFATWLVITLEKVQPSDFGRYKSLFDPAPPPRIVTIKDKPFLMQLASDFKAGRIDSATVNSKLEEYLSSK